MSRAKDILDKVNQHRAELGVGPTKVGFEYKLAIHQIIEQTNCTFESIGDRIGVDRKQVERYAEGAVPNHISGELLWALWEDVFPGRDPFDPIKGIAQRDWFQPNKPRRRERLVG